MAEPFRLSLDRGIQIMVANAIGMREIVVATGRAVAAFAGWSHGIPTDGHSGKALKAATAERGAPLALPGHTIRAC